MTNYRYAARRLAAILADELARSGTRLDLGDRIDRLMTGFGTPDRHSEYDDQKISYLGPKVGGYLRGIRFRADTYGPAPLPDEPIANEPTAPATYSIPHPPPQEYRVVDCNGRKWTHSKSVHGMFSRDEWMTDTLDMIADELEWPALLTAYGPVTIDEWTDEEQRGFELYGPAGARWGNPDTECPYYACALGWGHTGLHVDAEDNPIEAAPADGTSVDARITPHEAAETPCTCGHPDRHRPDCPRYARTSGVEEETEEEPEF